MNKPKLTAFLKEFFIPNVVFFFAYILVTTLVNMFFGNATLEFATDVANRADGKMKSSCGHIRMASQAWMSFLKVFKRMIFIVCTFICFPLFLCLITGIDYVDPGGEKFIDYELNFAFDIYALYFSVVEQFPGMFT